MYSLRFISLRFADTVGQDRRRFFSLQSAKIKSIGSLATAAVAALKRTSLKLLPFFLSLSLSLF